MSGFGLNSGFLSPEELLAYGVADAKERNILIHSTAVIVDFRNITFGSNIRIDPFVVLSCSHLTVGDYIHIASGSRVIGKESIEIGDFANISTGVSIFSSSDDYSGRSMTNPMIPEKYKNVSNCPILVGRHAIVGAHSVILPGSILNEGAALGAASLCKGHLEPWSINAGIPAKRLSTRDRTCLDFESMFTSEFVSCKLEDRGF